MNTDKGIKKTEFIGYLVTLVGLTIEMLRSTKPEVYSILIGVLTGIYIICRTIYKITATKIDDAIVENLEKILKNNNNTSVSK